MSSPAGLAQPQADFLARWMPSSSRAGVILNASPDLGGSLRSSSNWGSRHPDDSFGSQFVPLPASTSSSGCLSDHALVQAEMGHDLNQLSEERSLSLGLFGEMDNIEEIVNQSQDIPLMLKLEQLRQWQQRMQEQLKAAQLQELLRLQEDQQRLLGMGPGDQQGGPGSPRITGEDWGERTLQESPPLPHSPTTHAHTHPTLHSPTTHAHTHPTLHSPTTHAHTHPPLHSTRTHPAPQSPAPGSSAHAGEPGGQETPGTGAWSRAGQDRHGGEDTLSPQADGSMSADPSAYGDEPQLDSEDRPIHPVVGGQKQTFAELLEEQLRLEEQRLESGQQQHQQSQESTEGLKTNPKRAFLKRGEGLSRFTHRGKASLPNRGRQTDPKPPPQSKTNSRWASEARPSQTTSQTTSQKTSVGQRSAVQRKTAVLNKENVPRRPCSPPGGRPDYKAAPPAAALRVLGSHQKQNTEGADAKHPNALEGAGAKQPNPGVRQHQLGPLKEARGRKTGQPVQAVTITRTGHTPPGTTGPQQAALSAVTGAQKRGEASSRRAASTGKAVTGGIPAYSFELSFQEKLQRWDSDRQQENMELGEFELLEQAADELSFSSNSSFVQKVLQLDHQQRRHLVSAGPHPRRLSSTPIKSPRPSPPKPPPAGGGGQSSETSEDPLKRGKDRDDHQDEGESRPEASDISLHSSSEFGDEGGPDRAFPSSLGFPTSNPPYDRRSYQDRGAEEEGSGAEQGGDESTLREGDEHGQGALLFDDDDTWNDLEEAGDEERGGSPVPTATAFTPTERTLTRKVAGAKGTQLDTGGAVGTANREQDPPPTSQLMARLFPSLKPKAQPAAPPPPVDSKMTEDASGRQAQQSRQLRERLVELELEIERFRTENAALTKLRQDNERNQESLRKERAEFEQRKAEELSRLEELRKEETRKLQRERKVFEMHASAARALPDKREHEEIQSLKQQLSSVQEELRRKESRWSSSHSRLRQQVDSLSATNAALREEVRTLERLRLSAWRRSQPHGEKEKEEEDRRGREPGGPGPTENTTAALRTKVVTFSSPPERERSLPLSCTATGGRPTGTGPLTTGTSSLKSCGPSPAPGPSSVPGPTPEERPQPGSRGQDSLARQEHSHNLSPQRAGGEKTETELREVQQQESSEELITHPDGKTERVLACGTRLVVFPNGTRKEVSADGLTAKVTFFNGDIKQVMADQRVIYYYADAQTTHTTYPDGIQVLQFPNSQTEKHFPDGGKEITFPDQTVQSLFPDGREETRLTDGTVILLHTDGSKEIHFNTGQKEVHTAGYKRREYPDGTVKTVYTDGRQETRYPTGRVRVKDKNGTVVQDSGA